MAAIKKIEDLTSKVNMWISKLKEEDTKLEYCQNPWNPSCASLDIKLYIIYEGRTIPICTSCWQKISMKVRNVKSPYTCPVCGKKEIEDIHQHNALDRYFINQGFMTIREEKILGKKRWSSPISWCEPDLFVLKNLRLEKVVEVIVKEGYSRTKEKVNKIIER